MKLSLWLFLCLMVLQLPSFSRGYGQSPKVSISGTYTLQQIFEKIEEQTGKQVYYANKIMDDQTEVTVKLANVSIDELLGNIIKDKNLTWKIDEKKIRIFKKNEEGIVPNNTNPAIDSSINLSGRVLDENGKPLLGATVSVANSNKGTITSNEGFFELKNVQKNAIIQVRYTGYQSQEIKLFTASFLSVKLKQTINELDETVVIAYGTTTKRYNTSNVSTVKSVDIEKQVISNPLLALQGRVPGMLVTQTTGVSGGSVNVSIRGRNSIANGNDPLYIVDGVPYSSTFLPSTQGNFIFGVGSNNSIGSPLSFINPSDIESIDVLKDADATAIYGSRGANGVVLITTKKGKAGAPKVDINLSYGISQVPKMMKLMNTQQYLEMRHEAFANDNVTPTSSSGRDLFVWDTTRYTDWQKKLIGGTAQYNNFQASLSGGNVSVQYLVGLNYHRETTVFPGDFADKKVSANFGLSTTSENRKFKTQFSANYLSDNNNLFAIDLTSLAYYSPDAPQLYNSDGSLNWANSTWKNPFSNLLLGLQTKSKNLIANSVISYEIIPGLLFKVSTGYTNMQVYQRNKTPLSSYSPATWSYNQSSASFTNNNSQSWLIEPQLTYSKTTGNYRLESLIGGTIQRNDNIGNIVTGTGYASDELLDGLSGAASISKGVTTNNVYRYASIFARFNYIFKERYLFNLTGRRDGSSRFGPGKQFANFGAVGAGWIFTNELFLKKKFKFLSFGKLRASYGITGNDQIGDYKYIDLYNSTYNPYQGVQGLSPVGLFNANFAWEVIKKFELGLELGFIKDKILISASYYRNRSSNQLVDYRLPSVTGATSVTANLPAIVQNKGFELVITTTNLSTNRFKWSTAFNLSFSRNKLVDYKDFSTSPYADIYVIGKPLTITRTFHYLGVDEQTGVYKFADKNGKATFNPVLGIDDQTLINTTPSYYGGIQNDFNYKGIELSFFIQFTKQIGQNNLLYTSIQPGYRNYNQPIEVYNRWRQPGDKTNIQKYSQAFGSDAYNAYTNYAKRSDYAYTDASFIRLKNINLSYQIPRKFVNERMNIKNLKFFVQGQNLLTWTNHYIGYDPETQSVNYLPILRYWVFGLSCTL